MLNGLREQEVERQNFPAVGEDKTVSSPLTLNCIVSPGDKTVSSILAAKTGS